MQKRFLCHHIIIIKKNNNMKNWVVKVKPLTKKGAENHKEYLLDLNHDSHSLTSNIEHLSGDFDKIMEENDQLMLVRHKNNKGGRPPKNVGRSIVFSLPKEIKPSPEIWKKVVDGALEEVSKLTGEKKEDLSHFAVLHEEPTKNSHIHLLMTQNPNGLYNKRLTNKGVITACKIAFNRVIKEEMNLSPANHIPEKTNVRDLPLWMTRKNKKAEQLKEIEEQDKQIEHKNHEIRIKQGTVNLIDEDIKLKNGILDTLTAGIAKQHKQVNKWIKSGLKYIRESLKGDKATAEAVETLENEPNVKNSLKDGFYNKLEKDSKNPEINNVRSDIQNCSSCGKVTFTGSICMSCDSKNIEKEIEKDKKKRKNSRGPKPKPF
jgi:hypothetical protein